MGWTIEYAESVHKAIRKLDRPVQRRLRNFLERRLAQMDNPRRLGVALKGASNRNLWRYRVGDYRIVAEIDDVRIRILVVRVAHRRHVYRA